MSTTIRIRTMMTIIAMVTTVVTAVVAIVMVVAIVTCWGVVMMVTMLDAVAVAMRPCVT